MVGEATGARGASMNTIGNTRPEKTKYQGYLDCT